MTIVLHPSSVSSAMEDAVPSCSEGKGCRDGGGRTCLRLPRALAKLRPSRPNVSSGGRRSGFSLQTSLNCSRKLRSYLNLPARALMLSTLRGHLI